MQARVLESKIVASWIDSCGGRSEKKTKLKMSIELFIIGCQIIRATVIVCVAQDSSIREVSVLETVVPVVERDVSVLERGVCIRERGVCIREKCLY